MAQNMDDPDFKRKCAAMWNDIAPFTTIDKFHEKIALHAKSIFLGYVDLTIGFKLASGNLSQWKLRGIQVKILGGKPHLDMPSDRGSNDEFYQQYFPKTAEDRQIFTTLVFKEARVKEAVENAAKQIEAQSVAAAAEQEVSASVDHTDAVEGSVGAQVANPFEDVAGA